MRAPPAHVCSRLWRRAKKRGSEREGIAGRVRQVCAVAAERLLHHHSCPADHANGRGRERVREREQEGWGRSRKASASPACGHPAAFRGGCGQEGVKREDEDGVQCAQATAPQNMQGRTVTVVLMTGKRGSTCIQKMAASRSESSHPHHSAQISNTQMLHQCMWIQTNCQESSLAGAVISCASRCSDEDVGRDGQEEHAVGAWHVALCRVHLGVELLETIRCVVWALRQQRKPGP